MLTLLQRERMESYGPRFQEMDRLMQMAAAIAAGSVAHGGVAITRPPQPAVKPLKEGSRARRARGEAIDFHLVEPHQRAIDKRLANWGAWCNGGWGGSAVSPMFRLVPPPPRVRGDGACHADTVDGKDAEKIAEAVSALPQHNRKAIHWSYVRPSSPSAKCRDLGVSLDGLALLVRDGRQMLINRGV